MHGRGALLRRLRLAGIFSYFISLSAVDHARPWALLVAGLAISATLHGLFGTLVPRSLLPSPDVSVQGGLTSATELTHGLLEAPAPRGGGPRIAS